ncbi:MAG: hypothetical protein R2742_13755 [Micropruina glycogenica]
MPRTQMVYTMHQNRATSGFVGAAVGFQPCIPVIGDDLDDICGVLHLKDAIRRMYDNPRAQATETVESLMRRPSAPTANRWTSCCARCSSPPRTW